MDSQSRIWKPWTNANHGFHDTKLVSGDSLLDWRSENVTWVDSEKGNILFARGRSTMCSPFAFWSTKKLVWDRVNPSQPGGGGIVPSPQVHFLKYLKNGLSYGLETFGKFKWTNFQNKKLIFNRPRPPLIAIAMSKVDALLWKYISAVCMLKLIKTRWFCANSMKSVPNEIGCGNLGLIFHLMASWWQFSFRTHFRASTTLS